MNDHDANRRAAFSGVTADDLDRDKQIWTDIGEAVAALARMIADGCGASAFCAGRPSMSVLCARLVEAIDDQLDVTAWVVIETTARTAASR